MGFDGKYVCISKVCFLKFDIPKEKKDILFWIETEFLGPYNSRDPK